METPVNHKTGYPNHFLKPLVRSWSPACVKRGVGILFIKLFNDTLSTFLLCWAHNGKQTHNEQRLTVKNWTERAPLPWKWKCFFYLTTHSTHFIYGYMVSDHSDSERGNPLPPHVLLFLISSKGSFICIIPQTFGTPVVEHWLEREIAQWVHPMKDRSDDPSHNERTPLPRSYISLPRVTTCQINK